MKRIISTTLITLYIFLLTLEVDVLAEWPSDSKVNVPVCTSQGSQTDVVITTDDSGGAIVVWRDERNGANVGIYAQRIDASGSIRWDANGVAICTAPGDRRDVTAVSDGSGGAVIVWEDRRSGNSDIYAQRVDEHGVIKWATDGISICTAANSQWLHKVVYDGTDGFIIVWQDWRSGNDWDIYAQRVNINGVVQWTVDGVGIATGAKNQLSPDIAPDGTGGAITVWHQFLGGGDANIYAQKVDVNGVAQWGFEGLAVCNASLDQLTPVITADGAGGAIIIWVDDRNTNYDLFAQRINASGSLLWTPKNGVPICKTAIDQENPVIINDGASGAIITWENYRDANNIDIFAQRVDANGTIMWLSSGVPVGVGIDWQYAPTITTDGSNGAIIAWEDFRNPSADVYAQRVDAGGAVLWAANGVSVSAAQRSQGSPAIVSDNTGGAIIVWEDSRSGNYDIYAQRLNLAGVLGGSAAITA
ncbi:MAG: hypothetical protein Q6360_07390, partial [Candidatus Brocadiales bacterium]|nr:hypothetical protein [Candidatus Brocadiales bacterium]